MDEIGVFSPEQARALWQDYLTRRQLQPQTQANYPQRRPIDEPSPHRVFIKNTESEIIPAYACVRVVGVEVIGGQTAIQVEKPSSTDGEFLFNGPYPIEAAAAATESEPEKFGVGWAYRYGIVIALGNGTAPTAVNVTYQPVVSTWTIEESAGGFFTVFGEHNIATDAVIGRFAGGGKGIHEIWFTIISVECPSPTETILTVLPTHYTHCTGSIPGADPYNCYVIVEDVCSILQYYTAEDLVGRVGRATYMYPYACGEPSDCDAGLWLVDTICGSPECA